MGGIGERGKYGVFTPTTPAVRRVEQWHHPHHQATPVVAHEDGALDADRVQQAYQVAGQVVDVVGGDIRRPVAAAIAALVWGEHAEAGLE
jgi:hypothetical protein